MYLLSNKTDDFKVNITSTYWYCYVFHVTVSITTLKKEIDKCDDYIVEVKKESTKIYHYRFISEKEFQSIYNKTKYNRGQFLKKMNLYLSEINNINKGEIPNAQE